MTHTAKSITKLAGMTRPPPTRPERIHARRAAPTSQNHQYHIRREAKANTYEVLDKLLAPILDDLQGCPRSRHTSQLMLNHAAETFEVVREFCRSELRSTREDIEIDDEDRMLWKDK